VKSVLKFIAIALAVGAASVASAQVVYSIFSPNGALSGDWQYQNVNLGASSYILGTLGSDHGGTGVSSSPDDSVLVGNGSSLVQTSIPACLDSGGSHLNYNASTNALTCGTSGAPMLNGATASLGGGLLAAGGCSTGTATVTGATTSMTAVATPTTFPGNGNVWMARVSAADTVTVYLCAMVLGTPTASVYNVRVIP
jgi:hypothetical protein